MNNRIVENPGQIAIIVRVRYRGIKITEALSERKIPWFDRSKLPFVDGWEVNLTLNLLALACEFDFKS